MDVSTTSRSLHARTLCTSKNRVQLLFLIFVLNTRTMYSALSALCPLHEQTKETTDDLGQD